MLDRMVYQLPDGEELLRRLQSVDVGVNDYMAQRFYPLFKNDAGRELESQEIVLLFAHHIAVFMLNGYSSSMEALMYLNVPHWIDALVDDPSVAEQAKQFHDRLMAG